jgi:phosphoesterase RecJ-like protein
MTLHDAAAFLRANDDYIIVSHDGPDADGLGAAYALTLALRSVGKKAWPVLAELPPAKFRFIDQAGLFLAYEAEADLPHPPEDASFVVVDTHDLGYLGTRFESLVARSRRLLVVDHHEPRNPPRDFQYIDATASSSCELVYLLGDLLGAQLGLDGAEALFAGIVYDTGSFAYPKTSERTFECALKLTRQGVKPSGIHQRMYESSSVGFLLLQKAVLASLELVSDSRVAVQTLSRDDILRSGAAYEDAEDFINTPLVSARVEVSVFFKENLDGKLRCSLRSKGGINVAHIAQGFGGGGHKTASGFSCNRPLEPMKEAVLETIIRALDA